MPSVRVIVQSIAVVLASVGAARPARAEPCVTATAACTEWVKLGAGPERSLVYRTQALDAPSPAVTRALIVVHGAGRNADGYFRTAVAAAFLAGALNDTLVISPRFASNDGTCTDVLASDEISWTCSGNSWRTGGVAKPNETLTSFDLVDEILRRIARKDLFPGLRAIVVSGHSAGGQYVSRYAMANRVHGTLGVPITYVVSNPSSYAYLDADRPAPAGGAAGAVEQRPYAEGRNCTTYDHWPYGLQQRGGYAARLGDDQLKKQIVDRPVTYLLGELDTLPLANFDASCPAMAQGPNRLARGQAYAAAIVAKHGARHTVTIVPACGHNARCMFTTDRALPILFPKP